MSSATERKRQQRARQRAGDAYVPAWIEFDLVQALLERGLLPPHLADDHEAIERAIKAATRAYLAATLRG